MAKSEKSKKAGRGTRKPGNARYKLRRPDLDRKFKNVLKSCGPEFARKWVNDMLDKKEPVVKYSQELRNKYGV